jgi:hypothetical protein
MCYLAYLPPRQNTEPTTNVVPAAPTLQTVPTQHVRSAEASTVQVQHVYTGSVVAHSLRVRERPSIESHSRIGLPRGHTVYAYGMSADAQWLFVEYEKEHYGWVSRVYVDTGTRTELDLAILDENTAFAYVQHNP